MIHEGGRGGERWARAQSPVRGRNAERPADKDAAKSAVEEAGAGGQLPAGLAWLLPAAERGWLWKVLNEHRQPKR